MPKMNINDIWEKIMQFYSWLYSETGLERWQFISISLATLVLLVLFLRQLRKSGTRKIHRIHSKAHPEIIGTKLSGGGIGWETIYSQKYDDDFDQEEEKRIPWGQSTKQWRQLKERIIQLQRDLKKHQQSEEHLKKQLADVKTANIDLQKKIIEHKKIEENLNLHISELKAGSIPSNEINIKHEPVLEEVVKPELGTQNADFKSQTIDPIPQAANSDGTKDDGRGTSDDGRSTSDVPLDIKELKAISDLAKRLQERNHNRPIE